jgi:hypothetical protein
LEVIGWNIGTMKNIKKPIALQLRDLGADVLCLQELREVTSGVLPNYSLVCLESTEIKINAAIAVKEGIDWRRICVEQDFVAVELDVGKGYRIIVSSIYINSQTNKQWRELFSRLIAVVLEYQSRNYVVVVAGDFNMQLETTKMQELTVILLWVARGESGHPRNGGNAREIDYVLSKRKIIKKNIPQYLKQVSDHQPIWCVIQGIHVSIKYRYMPSAANTDRIIKKLIEKGYDDRQKAWTEILQGAKRKRNDKNYNVNDLGIDATTLTTQQLIDAYF